MKTLSRISPPCTVYSLLFAARWCSTFCAKCSGTRLARRRSYLLTAGSREVCGMNPSRACTGCVPLLQTIAAAAAKSGVPISQSTRGAREAAVVLMHKLCSYHIECVSNAAVDIAPCACVPTGLRRRSGCVFLPSETSRTVHTNVSAAAGMHMHCKLAEQLLDRRRPRRLRNCPASSLVASPRRRRRSLVNSRIRRASGALSVPGTDGL